MGARFTFSPLPDLLAGERWLVSKKTIWGISSKSLPSYRLTCSLPPFLGIAAIVTDRRVLLIGYLFRLCTQQFSLWFPGNAEAGDRDVVTAVSVGKIRLVGPYVEIVSENSEDHWYRNRQLRVRLFMKHPESIREAISTALLGQTADMPHTV